MKITAILLALVMAIGSLTACTATKAQRGALIGGTTGAVIGGVATRSAGGALVGGAVGATAGYIIGKNSYRCWKRNAFTGERYRGWCVR
jgi:hypothetical protein